METLCLCQLDYENGGPSSYAFWKVAIARAMYSVQIHLVIANPLGRGNLLLFRLTCLKRLHHSGLPRPRGLAMTGVGLLLFVLILDQINLVASNSSIQNPHILISGGSL